jgi:hypothetical protein
VRSKVGGVEGFGGEEAEEAVPEDGKGCVGGRVVQAVALVEGDE